ncbi:MAG TPA: hypothetical protein VMG08_15590 [Allosphingosinicella sp.]|nr:hypothetical protein [Allosphingosinicella sp.]
MDQPPDSPRPFRRIDAAAAAIFIAALRRGAPREAAAEAGFSLTGFYGRRRRDPAFAKAWTEALAAPEAVEHRTRAYAERGLSGELRIAPANRRVVQRRRRPHVRFTQARQELYLEHLAASGDSKAAATVAGVAISTVTLHRRMNPDFAALHTEAVAIAVPKLEDEALRLRHAAQERLRAAMERGAVTSPRSFGTECRCPNCGHEPDDDAQFDRTMQLLARWERKARRVDSRFRPDGRRQRWSFEETILEIDSIMRGYGLRRGIGREGEAEA